MGEKTTGFIRKMNISDIEQVYEIEAASFTTPWSIQSFMEEMMNPLACYWVWEVDGRIGGYLGSWVVLDEVQVTNIAVHPSCRRLGGGEQLLAHLCNQMETGEIVSISLEVRPSNQEALSLYRKFGFSEVGRRSGYYQDTQEDALIYEVKRKNVKSENFSN